jgi:hypothetical protein
MSSTSFSVSHRAPTWKYASKEEESLVLTKVLNHGLWHLAVAFVIKYVANGEDISLSVSHDRHNR